MGLVGGMIGGPPAGWVADKWGRKVSVAVSGIVFAVGYAIIALAKVPALAVNPEGFKGLLMVGRLVTGIASGWTFVSTPVCHTFMRMVYLSINFVASAIFGPIVQLGTIVVCVCVCVRLCVWVVAFFG